MAESYLQRFGTSCPDLIICQGEVEVVVLAPSAGIIEIEQT